MSVELFRTYNSYLRELFGCRVQKISIDAGLTCPNRDGFLGHGGCIYCNERGSGTGAAGKSLSVGEQIRAGKISLRKRYNASKFLAYFQSFSNTYAPLAILRGLYTEALADPDVVGITIGTRPDCVPDEILEYLSGLSTHHLVWMEYGLQSAKDRTLECINRRHTVQAFEDAVCRTRRMGIPVCAHVILGLPGETLEDMLDTARFIASRDIQAIKIHLLYVVRGTILEGWLQTGRYTCLTREEYTAAVSEFLSRIPPHMIVQRLTGDPHPEELAAPLWALEKQRNLQEIRAYMEEHHIRQGQAFAG